MGTGVSRGALRAFGFAAALLVAAAAVAELAPAAGQDVGAQLRGLGRPDLLQRWRDAEAVEGRARGLERDHPAEAVEIYLEAARRFEEIAQEGTGLPQPWWRSARSFWRAGDALPLDAREERVRYFEAAEAGCVRGIALDPECAECLLWKFASMGRLSTTRGFWTSIRQLPEMARLLDRGIELEPRYREEGDDSTLGDLHYSSAIFYRVLPDGFWAEWLLGVRGDKERALTHVRAAYSLHPGRLDYQIELGSQLLCLGSTRGDSARLTEGRRVMRAAILREPETRGDVREIAAARIMLEEPRRSCGYSGDTWVEIDRRSARGEAEQAGLVPRRPSDPGVGVVSASLPSSTPRPLTARPG